MLDYFPGYNKFRDVKNIIVIEQFAMALLGALAIKEVYQRKVSDAEFMKALKYSFGITGGLALIFAIIPSLAGSFSGSTDAQILQMGWPKQLINALMADREVGIARRCFSYLCVCGIGSCRIVGLLEQ